jgi:hypothetical protein
MWHQVASRALPQNSQGLSKGKGKDKGKDKGKGKGKGKSKEGEEGGEKETRLKQYCLIGFD